MSAINARLRRYLCLYLVVWNHVCDGSLHCHQVLGILDGVALKHLVGTALEIVHEGLQRNLEKVFEAFSEGVQRIVGLHLEQQGYILSPGSTLNGVLTCIPIYYKYVPTPDDNSLGILLPEITTEKLIVVTKKSNLLVNLGDKQRDILIIKALGHF